SNENETVDTDDGTFSPDASSLAPGTLRLRSERIGTGDGRVYLIVSRATDASLNSAAACTIVVVPKSQSIGDIASMTQMAAVAKASGAANRGPAPPDYFASGNGPVIGPKQ